VTPRHIALVFAAVAVLGVGVYLYVAVNSTSSAVANVRDRSPEVKASPREDKPEKVAAKTPEPRASRSRVNPVVRDAAATQVAATATAERPGADIDIKKDEMMASANKAYDRGDFDEAMVMAKKVLSNDPANTRMLRIMVSASCILGDSSTAQSHYLTLPIGGNDRADMKKRCDRYGVTFNET
jgi:hypothetical protein